MDYDKLAKSYNDLYLEEQLEKLRVISRHIKVKVSDKLLDIGCGTGISTNFFKCKSIGIDSSKKLIKFGKGNLIYGVAEKLPFKERFFDIVLCITAIHNFENPEKAIEEILRVKKDKATVVITLLKKSKKYNVIRKLIKRNFKTKEIDSQKDTIFISHENRRVRFL